MNEPPDNPVVSMAIGIAVSDISTLLDEGNGAIVKKVRAGTRWQAHNLRVQRNGP